MVSFNLLKIGVGLHVAKWNKNETDFSEMRL